MRAFTVLLRRELGGYFATTSGYLVMAAVLLLLGISFLDLLDQLGEEPNPAPFTVLFFSTYYFWTILLLTSPVMTMRTFAQEKSSGTYETLMTTPVSEGQVVAAKFTGALLFYLLTWLPFVGYTLVLQRFSVGGLAFSPPLVGSTFLGLLLIGSLYMALGCFASSLTQNQIVAAILSYLLGLALFLASLKAIYGELDSGFFGVVLKYVSLTEHMEDFARGIIDTRAIVFYVSTTALFLFLTLKVVECRRWR